MVGIHQIFIWLFRILHHQNQTKYATRLVNGNMLTKFPLWKYSCRSDNNAIYRWTSKSTVSFHHLNSSSGWRIYSPVDQQSQKRNYSCKFVAQTPRKAHWNNSGSIFWAPAGFELWKLWFLRKVDPMATEKPEVGIYELSLCWFKWYLHKLRAAYNLKSSIITHYHACWWKVHAASNFMWECSTCTWFTDAHSCSLTTLVPWQFSCATVWPQYNNLFKKFKILSLITMAYLFSPQPSNLTLLSHLYH